MKEQLQRDAVEQRLREFIVEELLEEPFGGNDPLAEGAVDSLGVEQLVEYVHEAWGVELGEQDLVADNFESVAVLAALVEARC